MHILVVGVMKTPMPIAGGDEQRAMLENMVKSQVIDITAARRARTVLLAGDGMGDGDKECRLNIGRIQVPRWRGQIAATNVVAAFSCHLKLVSGLVA